MFQLFFKLLKARNSFRENMASKLPNYIKGYIEVDFATCMSLAHALDLLLYHGLRSFYIFLQGMLQLTTMCRKKKYKEFKFSEFNGLSFSFLFKGCLVKRKEMLRSLLN